jgi:hypothetical protein
MLERPKRVRPFRREQNVIKILPQESSQGAQEEEPMRDWKTLSHVKWICQYHIIFVTKYRHQTIYGKLRSKIGGIIRNLCRQKGLDLLEGNAMKDHVRLSGTKHPQGFK